MISRRRKEFVRRMFSGVSSKMATDIVTAAMATGKSHESRGKLSFLLLLLKRCFFSYL